MRSLTYVKISPYHKVIKISNYNGRIILYIICTYVSAIPLFAAAGTMQWVMRPQFELNVQCIHQLTLYFCIQCYEGEPREGAAEYRLI